MRKSELGFQAQVRKVVELTKCSMEDAAYVLTEHDNDVDQAVNAIFDQPDANMWKENKKKSKKDLGKKQLQQNGPGNRRFGNRARPENIPSNRRNQLLNNNNNKTVTSAKVGSTGKNASAGFESSVNQTQPYKKSQAPAADNEFSLKNGPLVFESSVISQQSQQPPTHSKSVVNNDFPPVGSVAGNFSTFSPSVYDSNSTNAGDSKKLSFAAVAAKSKKPPPQPMLAQPQNVASFSEFTSSASNIGAELKPVEEDVKSVSESIKHTTDLEDVQQQLNGSIQSNTADEGNPLDDDCNKLVEEKSSIGTSNMNSLINVNREFTDQLKNDIGIGLPSHNRNSVSDTVDPTVSLSYSNVFNSSHQSSSAANLQASPILDLISNPEQPTRQSLDVGVEFLDNVSSSRPTGFEFGFNKLAITSTHNSVIDRLQQAPIPQLQQVPMPQMQQVLMPQMQQPPQVTQHKQQQVSVAQQQQQQTSMPQMQQVMMPQMQQAPVPQHQQQQQQQASMAQHQQTAMLQHQRQMSLQQQQQTSMQQHQQATMPQHRQSPPKSMQEVPPLRSNATLSYTYQSPLGVQARQQSPPKSLQEVATPWNNAGLSYTYHSPLGVQTGMMNQSKNGPMVFESSVINQQSQQPPTHSKSVVNNEFPPVGSAAGNLSTFSPSVYDSSSTNAGDPKKLSFAAVAPPPGFSAPHFMTQQTLQSLFHMPSYPMHTPMPFPLLFPGGGTQQQQSQQRQPQVPQNHYGQQAKSGNFDWL